MELNQLTQEQKELISGALGLEGDTFALGNQTSFDRALRVFTDGQGYQANDVAFGEEDTASPRSQFANLARRAVGGETLAANDAFILTFLAEQAYGAELDYNGTFDAAELSQLSIIIDGIDANIGPVGITQNFEQAAHDAAMAELEAAELAAATFASQEGIREFQANLNALGVRTGEITGEITAEDITAFRSITVGQGGAAGNTLESRSFALSYTPAGETAGQAMSDLRRELGLVEGGTFNVDAANGALSHLTAGLDNSDLIEAALTSTDPQEIMIAQAAIGAEVTGEWDLASLTKAEEALTSPADGAFPPSLYSAISQTDINATTVGMVDVDGVVAALGDGSMIMPSAAQLDTIAPGLSEASAATQAREVAAWINENPTTRMAQYGDMVATQAITPETQKIITDMRAELTTIRAAEVTTEQSVETTWEDFQAADAIDTIPSIAVDVTAVETELIQAEAAIASGNYAQADIEVREYIAELQGTIEATEIAFVENHMRQITQTGHDLSITHPEVSEVLLSGDVEQIRDLLMSYDLTDSSGPGSGYEQAYSTFFNTPLQQALFSADTMTNGWSQITASNRELDSFLEEYGISPDELPGATTPETPAVEEQDPAELISDAAPAPGEAITTDDGVTIARMSTELADTLGVSTGGTQEIADYLASLETSDVDRVAGTVTTVEEMVAEACAMADSGAPAQGEPLGIDGVEAAKSFAQCAAERQAFHTGPTPAVAYVPS